MMKYRSLCVSWLSHIKISLLFNCGISRGVLGNKTSIHVKFKICQEPYHSVSNLHYKVIQCASEGAQFKFCCDTLSFKERFLSKFMFVLSLQNEEIKK